VPVFLFATANEKDGIDPSLLRAGRLSIEAECSRLPDREASRMLGERLTTRNLPVPSAAHLRDLIGGSAQTGADIDDAVERTALRAEICPPGEITPSWIARALVEQWFPIPDDQDEPEIEIHVAHHECGHALGGFALGLSISNINLFDVWDQEASVFFRNERMMNYLDGFCEIVSLAMGKAMERFVYSEDGVALHAAGGDYQAIVESFVELTVAGGGADGSRFDWSALKDEMKQNAATRITRIDHDATLVMEAVAALAWEIVIEADKRVQKLHGIGLIEALKPLVDRLCVERIILGSDATVAISEIVGGCEGFHRTLAHDVWARLSTQLHSSGGSVVAQEV